MGTLGEPSLAGVHTLAGAGRAGTTALRVVQDRAYRVGVFLVVDALVENISPRRVDGAEVSVEFYTFFDQLVSLEHTVLRPARIEPGQKATLRVATPNSDSVRKIRYRFTWRENAEQFQNRPEEEKPTWR
ncbi:MAG: hypothetical protein HY726_15835 [Candidatus Rokubacteria bacterium]|nr:hypothetical protein [Candidatus Rokubacteria bacterium]